MFVNFIHSALLAFAEISAWFHEKPKLTKGYGNPK